MVEKTNIDDLKSKKENCSKFATVTRS